MWKNSFENNLWQPSICMLIFKPNITLAAMDNSEINRCFLHEYENGIVSVCFLLTRAG